jgi:hypothetical protein
MSAAELKKNKPKYTETTEGTHCMGNHWTVCCPNRHLKYERYQPTKEVIQIHYKGGIYRVFVCTGKCSRDITALSKSNPEQFKKMFVKLVKPNGDLVLQHRDTHKVAQIAQKVDTYDDKSSSSTSKTKKQKGGNFSKYMRLLGRSRSRGRGSSGRRKHRRNCGHTRKHKKNF